MAGWRQFLEDIELYRFATVWKFRLRTWLRQLRRIDRRRIRAYLREPSPAKLHLGSGGHYLEGWLDADLDPNLGNIQLDVTRPMPFDDNTFDYVFHEHMIYMLSFPEACKMVAESNRVLKPGGRTRVATADLRALIELYQSHKTPLQEAYIRNEVDKSIPWATGYEDTFVINNSMRCWGGLFTWDEKVLRGVLQAAGFIDVIHCELNESSDPELRGLENESRMPEGLLAFETLVLEAVKPHEA